MPRGGTGLGGFMQGFVSTYSVMDQAKRQHEALKLAEQESKLKRQLLEMQTQKMGADISKMERNEGLSQAIGLLAAQPTPMKDQVMGGPAEHAEGPAQGYVPPGFFNQQVEDPAAKATQLNTLKALLLQTPEGLKAFAGETFKTPEQPDPVKQAVADYLKRMTPGGVAPGGTPSGQAPSPAQAPSVGGMRLEGLNVGGLKLAVPSFQSSIVDIPLPGGVMGKAIVARDPQNPHAPPITTFISSQPNPTQQQMQAAVALSGMGMSLQTMPLPQLENTINQYAAILSLPSEQQGPMIEKFHDAVSQWQPGTSFAVPVLGTVMTGERKRQVQQKGAETEAQTKARLLTEAAMEPLRRLTTDELKSYDLPAGSTVADAARKRLVPATAQQQGIQAAAGATLKIIDKLDAALASVNLPAGGVWDRIASSPRMMAEYIGQNGVAVYERTKEAVLANIVRTFGERGTLTDQDIARARSLLPNLMPGWGKLPDSKAFAQTQMKLLRSMVQDMASRPSGWRPPEGERVVTSEEAMSLLEKPAAAPLPPGAVEKKPR